MQDVPKIAVGRLQAMAVRDPHPEAELFAAFAERSLARSERNAILEHLAHCAECRQMLEIALAVSETETLTTPEFARPGWLSWPAVRWGFATGVALALALGILQYERRRGNELALGSSRHAEVAKKASSNSVEHSDAGNNQEPQTASGTEGATTSAGSSPLTAKNILPAAADVARAGTKETPSKPESFIVARNQNSDQLHNHEPAMSQYDSSNSSDVVKAKAAVPPQALGTVPIATPNIELRTAPSLMQRASPRWNIAASGGLQRSFDAGKTWQDVNVAAETAQGPTGFVFRAVAAMGPEVWAGGSGGALYHSRDSGTRWQQVFPFAAGANPAGDITTIEFSTPQQGKISTSAGEIWATSDNGQTWRKQ
jgi:hypothetical protein